MKGILIPQHQLYLTAIAEEFNERPRATLGYLAPREAFERFLVASIPLTPSFTVTQSLEVKLIEKLRNKFTLR